MMPATTTTPIATGTTGNSLSPGATAAGITGARPLQADLYMAMLGSALYVKSSIEGRKSSNSFGCIIWCARATRMS